MIGVDMDYVAAGHSYYTVETHLRHLGEARLGDRPFMRPARSSPRMKSGCIFPAQLHDSETEHLLATAEQMLLHVDSKTGKTAPASPEILARLARIAEAHTALPRPDGAGRHVGQKR